MKDRKSGRLKTSERLKKRITAARPCLLVVLLMVCMNGGSAFAAEDRTDTPAPDTASVDEPVSEENAASQETPETGGVQLVPPVLERKLLSPYRMLEKALEAEGRSEEIVWLSETPFLALERPELTGVPQGALLILHDDDQHPDWPKVIKPLREQMPEKGWHTLAIALPFAEFPQVPERTVPVKQIDSVPAGTLDAPPTDADDTQTPPTTDENAQKGSEEVNAQEERTTEPDAPQVVDKADINGDQVALEAAVNSDQAPASTEENMINVGDQADAKTEAMPVVETDTSLARLQQGLTYLTEKGFLNIVMVGYRHSAQVLLQYIEQSQMSLPTDGLAFVLIDPRLTAKQQAEFGTLLGPSFNLKILDIVDKSDAEAKRLAKQRQGSVRRAHISGYTQAMLPVRAGDFDPPAMLVRRVKGWLQVHAPGMDAKAYRNRP